MEYCAKCEREFVSEESLEQHLRHSSSHEYCVRCSKSFDSASALQQHLRDSSKHHICSICSTRMDFDTRAHLEAHLEKVHDHCVPCNRSFDSPQLLEEHDVSAHNLCTICKSYFATGQNLRCVRVHFAPPRGFNALFLINLYSMQKHIRPKIWNALAATEHFALPQPCSCTSNQGIAPQKWTMTGWLSSPLNVTSRVFIRAKMMATTLSAQLVALCFRQ